jgi:hypothetical protein
LKEQIALTPAYQIRWKALNFVISTSPTCSSTEAVSAKKHTQKSKNIVFMSSNSALEGPISEAAGSWKRHAIGDSGVLSTVRSAHLGQTLTPPAAGRSWFDSEQFEHLKALTGRSPRQRVSEKLACRTVPCWCPSKVFR